MIRAALIGLSVFANAAMGQGLSSARMVDSCGGTRVVVGHDDGLGEVDLAQIENGLNARLQTELPVMLDYTNVEAGAVIVSIPDGVGDANVVARHLTAFSFGMYDVLKYVFAGDFAADEGRFVAADIQDPTRRFLLDADAIVGGEMIVDAQVMMDMNNRLAISFRLSEEGGTAFAAYTSDHAGDPFALVVNDAVYSAPIIHETILGRTGMISGNSTNDEARALAVSLRSGPIPDGLRIISQSSVDGSDPSADFCP